MLPHPENRAFLIDSGLETTLIFQENVTLRAFASFEQLLSREGRVRLTAYVRRHTDIAEAHGAGFVFETNSWRANPDWLEQLGYEPAALERLNRQAYAFSKAGRDEFVARTGLPGIVSGCVGPRGDGYVAGRRMTAEEAESYHCSQIDVLAGAGVDIVTAMTMTYSAEAVGIVNAARKAVKQVAIAFTVETDGRLPDGTPLGRAIEEVDRATDGAAAYFLVNCAHPDHFGQALNDGGDWRLRIYGIRANASRMSHAELEASDTLDEGNPKELGRLYADMRTALPNLCLFGGCCGTDHRHVEAIAAACL